MKEDFTLKLHNSMILNKVLIKLNSIHRTPEENEKIKEQAKLKLNRKRIMHL